MTTELDTIQDLSNVRSQSKFQTLLGDSINGYNSDNTTTPSTPNLSNPMNVPISTLDSGSDRLWSVHGQLMDLWCRTIRTFPKEKRVLTVVTSWNLQQYVSCDNFTQYIDEIEESLQHLKKSRIPHKNRKQVKEKGSWIVF